MYKKLFLLLCAICLSPTLFAQVSEKPAEDFSFLVGSCAAFEPMWGDKPTEKRYEVYQTMMRTNGEFMLWMGDAVYYRKGDWKSYAAMVRRNELYRKEVPFLQKFLDTMPQYSVWDDHDFGGDNSHGNMRNKDSSLMVFKQFWKNPSYGTDSAKGVFHHFEYSDCAFFMLDDRYHSNTKTGEMLGEKQLNWLKFLLKTSDAKFKFVVSGTNFLANNGLTESYKRFKQEHTKFRTFLLNEKIDGVILISGDIHQSEISKEERRTSYPLYEFTCSPLTSDFILPFRIPNPYRIKGSNLREPNFGQIHVKGVGEERNITIEIHKTDGSLFYSKTLFFKDLRNNEELKIKN
jgi:alkaline phosphatase D